MIDAPRLRAPVDPASLAVFRIAFGSILLWQVVLFFANDWVAEYFIDPPFHFTYLGFGWVRPWPGYGMWIHCGVLGLAALGIALGFRYRASAAVFFLSFTYVFLLEEARYLNHFYLVILLAFLLIVVPAHRLWSLDARAGRASGAIPYGVLVVLRAQIGFVYLFAGIAKLNRDWLRAEPLRSWLEGRAEVPLLGPLLAWEGTAWLFSYGGLFLDLLAWPLLAWSRTRFPTFLIVCAFHLTNAAVFDIGIFPWLMIAATTLFFAPDWPRRWIRTAAAPAPDVPTGALTRLAPAGIAVWLAIQVLVPLRHFLYPGSVHWNEEGHAFAWHMKLRGKSSQTTFRVTDPESGEAWLVDPRDELTSWQYSKMGGRPDMLLQYAHHLADRRVAEGAARPEVRATAMVALNAREPSLLIDPAVDLAAIPRSLAHAEWILPFPD
ncbi:MAG: HTTM domain-containing protein [Planctomycetota bacterium]|nr:HTTM domain-containing protein [Planctomycetota bacterium]